jgi:hypothetical protein
MSRCAFTPTRHNQPNEPSISHCQSKQILDLYRLPPFPLTLLPPIATYREAKALRSTATGRYPTRFFNRPK